MSNLMLTRPKQLSNFQCGEVHCVTPTRYNVTCRICSNTFTFEKFPLHFKEHWKQVEKDYKDKEDRETSKTSSVQLSNDVIKIEEENFYYEDRFGHQRQQEAFPFEELDEKPIDLEELKEIQLVEMNTVTEDGEKKPEGILAAEPTDSFNIEFIEEEKDEFDDSENDPEWQDELSDEDTKSVQDGKTQPKKLKTEKDSQPVSCSHCPRWFRSNRGLKRHLLSNKVSIPNENAKTEHKCNECGEVFRSERLLLGHRWKHTGLSCDICGRTFTQAGNLKSHKIRHTGVKSQKCDQCSSIFFTKAELKLHKQRHERLRYICELCGRPCLNGSVLRSHMRRHTGERPAKCEICGKRFFSGFDLNVHSLSHTNERPFACELCSSTFKSKKSLRVHKLQHIPDRNYVCKICDKAFALEKGLVSHMRTHNTPYIELSKCKLVAE